PAPKLYRFGKLVPEKATEAELRGEKLFHTKAQCAKCHPAPFYTDQMMHDLRVEEFYNGRAEGWVKTFSLRGIKDSPPYLHDGQRPASRTFPNGSSFSGHSKILGYIEQEAAGRLIDFTVPWNNPKNAAACAAVVKVFLCPSDPFTELPNGWAGINYRANEGTS